MINREPQSTSIWKVDANGITARILLAFLTTAGIFYINIMPAVVSGLKEGLDFTNQQAGFVSSANLYGAAIGALAAVFLIKRINWRIWSYTLLIALLVIDAICIFIDDPTSMVVVRFIHGLTGGLLVGIGFGIISRTTEADKTFGYLLFIQWGLGGLGLMYLPELVPSYGTAALFLSLMAFTLVSLLMMPFIPHYKVEKNQSIQQSQAKLNKTLLILNLFAIFLFQAANMGLFAYIIGLGKAQGLSIEFMSPALASASWFALVGPFLVIIIGTKYGRTIPLVMSILITALCSWLLHYSESAQVYLIANIIIGVTWAFALPYMFGICSELDKAGQLAAMGGFASKVGLATGPMVGALILTGEQYDLVINVAVATLILCAVSVIKPAKLLDAMRS
ncbi:MAG: putative MFS family arabinose efflux permease [Patiriisocius sp.]|jgi:predicted MFS family arabinose efflux permease